MRRRRTVEQERASEAWVLRVANGKPKYIGEGKSFPARLSAAKDSENRNHRRHRPKGQR